jgi:hypothetical protein
LDETFGNRWIGHGSPITWTPHSPDLTPVETKHELVARIAIVAGTIWEMPGIFQRVQHNISRQCRTCNEVSGHHFEQLL